MGKGLKKILPIVAAFIIPVAGQFLAAKLATWAATTTATAAAAATTKATFLTSVAKAVNSVAMLGGGAAGGAVASRLGMTLLSGATGAGLGALTASLTGQKVGQAALLGGLGAAATGYFSTPATGYVPPPPAAPAVAPPAAPTSSVAGAPITAPSSAGGPITAPPPAGTPAAAATTAGAPAATAAAAPQTFVSALKSNIANVLPAQLAQATVMAAMGTAATDDPEMQALIDARRAELEELKNRDETAYQQQVQAANEVLMAARMTDPLARAQYAAADVRAAGAAATEAALRGVDSRRAGLREAVGRQNMVDYNTRAAQTFNAAYGQGVEQRARLQALGAQAIPPAPRTGFEGTGLLLNDLIALRRQQEEDAGTAAAAFVPYTGFQTGNWNNIFTQPNKYESIPASPPPPPVSPPPPPPPAGLSTSSRRRSSASRPIIFA